MTKPQRFLNTNITSFKSRPRSLSIASQGFNQVHFEHSARLATRPNVVRFNRTSGFTLIELMIALALGLLIVAAGLAIFLSSSRSLSLQAGMGEVQENANFGLSQIAYDLRHTNLDTISNQQVNAYQVGSGVIFTANNLPNKKDAQDATGTTPAVNEEEMSGFNATGDVSQEVKDDDNTNKKSDRLTIQYVPVEDEIHDCEGNAIKAETIDGVALPKASERVIIQRYYLAKSPKQVTGEPTAYSLMCDAGWYKNVANPPEVHGLNNNAQQMMQRVDSFKTRVSVKLPDNTRRYISLKSYTDKQATIKSACTTASLTDAECAKTYWQVMGVEIGILARSTGTIGSSANLNTQKEYTLAGVEVTLTGTDAVNQKYLRQAVNQVIAFRNTLGAQ